MTAEEYKSIWKKGVVLYGYDESGELATFKSGQSSQSESLSIVLARATLTTAHNAIAETATSSAINCVGYNSLFMYVGPFSDAQNWTFKIQGSLNSSGTFVDWYELTNTGSMVAMSHQCNAARGFTFRGVPGYIKVVATRDGTASTVTVKVQPFNQ